MIDALILRRKVLWKTNTWLERTYEEHKHYLSFANPNSTYLIRAFPLLTFLWVCSKISSFSYISQTATEQDRTDWSMEQTRYRDGCFCWRSSAAAATSFWFLPALLYSCRDASSDSPREPPWAPPSDSLGPPVPRQNDYKTVLVQYKWYKEEIQVIGVDKTPKRLVAPGEQHRAPPLCWRSAQPSLRGCPETTAAFAGRYCADCPNTGPSGSANTLFFYSFQI